MGIERGDHERESPAGGEDPLVQYLIVRRSAPAGDIALLEAAAGATLACHLEHAGSQRWREDFRTWAAGDQRKVVLRAREGEWARLVAELELASVGLGGGEPALACLPPRRRSQSEPILRRLQVYSAPLEEGLRGPASPVDPRAVLLVVDDRLGMSLGKAIAQVGHGALAAERLIAAPGSRVGEAWRGSGRPIQVRMASSAGWPSGSDTAVVIRDAGLTELAPGAPTVAVVAPR